MRGSELRMGLLLPLSFLVLLVKSWVALLPERVVVVLIIGEISSAPLSLSWAV